MNQISLAKVALLLGKDAIVGLPPEYVESIKYISQDSDGWWCGYMERPTIKQGSWSVRDNYGDSMDEDDFFILVKLSKPEHPEDTIMEVP